MTKMSSPWLMAWFGHSGSQAPQLMQSTVMRVDMSVALYDGSAAPGGKAAENGGDYSVPANACSPPSPIQTVFQFTNSRMPMADSSRP